MCGRYVRRSDKQRIAEHFHVHGSSVPDFGESFNVAPQTFQPVIRLNRDSGQREIVLMRWRLIPFWAKNAKMGLSTINAKAETVATAPAFREVFKTRRCLVPAEAAIRDRNEGRVTYAFAGLWECWRHPATKEPVETFTVITTDPNELLEPLHNRMPVIIQPKDYDRWLAPGDPQRPPVDLLRPFSAEQMTAWKVDRKVGNVKNETPGCIEPMMISEENGSSLFA